MCNENYVTNILTRFVPEWLYLLLGFHYVSNILYHKSNTHVPCKWNNYHCDLFRKCYSLNKFCKKHSKFFGSKQMKVNGQKGHEPLTNDDLVYKETQGHQVIIWTGQSVMIIMHIFDGIRSSWKTAYARNIHFQDWVFHVHLFKANLK